jgi:hypothetical protein
VKSLIPKFLIQFWITNDIWNLFDFTVSINCKSGQKNYQPNFHRYDRPTRLRRSGGLQSVEGERGFTLSQ